MYKHILNQFLSVRGHLFIIWFVLFIYDLY